MMEILADLCVVAALALISMGSVSKTDLSHYAYLNEYVLKQSEAMRERKPVSFEKGVSFNSMGHVNQGRTIDFLRHRVIVHLGNGYASLE